MRQHATNTVLTECIRILAEYPDQITLRQLYYRLVAAQVIENCQKSYKRLVAMLTKARKDGTISPAAFCDLTRESRGPYGWLDLGDYAQGMAQRYSRLCWQSQPRYLEVWVEKEALATVFAPLCGRHQVRLVVCRGYPSVSCLYEAARRFASEAGDGRECFLSYFGDFDPSGVDIPRNIGDELDAWAPGAAPAVSVVALTPEQIADHNLPPAPPKHTDTRAARFVAKHGRDTVELDALPPGALRELIESAIVAHIDAAPWRAETDAENAERERLAEIAGRLGE